MDFEQTRTSFPLPKSLRPTRIYRQGQRAYFGRAWAAPFLYWPQIGDFRVTNGKIVTINALTTAKGLGYHHQHLQPCLEGQYKFYYTFSGDTTPFPLERIVLLHRSNRRRNQHLVSAAKVPFELLRHFPLPHQLLNRAYLQTYFSQILQIARHAPVILQYRPYGFSVLQNWVSNQLIAHNQFLTIT